MDDGPKVGSVEESVSESQSVVSAMIVKVEQGSQCGLDSESELSVDEKSELSADSASGSMVTAESVEANTSPLNISQIEFSDGGILLGHDDSIQSALGSGTIQLEVAQDHFEGMAVIDEADSCDAASRFIDGQAVRLEDGSMAFIHTMPREGLQPVQLEDGTLAYLSQSHEELFNGEASGLGLEHLEQIPCETLDVKEVKMTAASGRKNNQARSGQPMEKTFHCLYEGCSRVYTTQHHLKVHERSHTGDRPFKCTVAKCGKAFATGYGLKSHTRVHTGETPYKCTELGCPKAFKTSGDLQKHLRTHTGERPFKCPVEGCHRAFTTSNIRKVHIRTHTGERPYICESCGRAFASATNFKNHIRIHTGEKPYSCKVPGCTKKFTEYSSLYKHNVVHTRDKPYACKLCGKHYRQTSTLAMHERTSHRKHVKINCASNNKNIQTDDVDADDLKRAVCLEYDSGNDLPDMSNILVKNVRSVQVQNQDGVEVPNKRMPTIIALQSESNSLLQENSSVYAVQLQPDGTLGTTQQILLVTDPSQLVALQQLAQVHVQNILTPDGNDSKTE